MDVKKTTQLQGITDLTVMAPVLRGLVPGTFNTCSYVRRLHVVLRVLNSVRQASRESSLQGNPFADSIGRFRSIHFFRFAVVPPADPLTGRYQLLLNVTFDGGWEPYMRLVWGPLGKLLDLIFCSCEGYPLASQGSFDDYVRWVRRQEVPSTFFYADSPATVADLHYLRALEELQRCQAGRPGVDVGAATLALKDPPANAIASDYAVDTSIRVLKALSVLREYFPRDIPGQPEHGQERILRLFARDLLADLITWIESGLFDPGRRFDNRNAAFVREREWLMSVDGKQDDPRADRKLSRSDVQAGIVEAYPEQVRHGVLVLARIDDPEKAGKAWLAGQDGPAATPDDKATQIKIYRSVALTYQGLARLGVPDTRLACMPQEFRVGMEQRAGVLGDVRGNHPEHWSRPLRNWPNKAGTRIPIELSTVHVVMQLRAELSVEEEERAADGVTLAPTFETEIHDLEAKYGLKVLHVQPMRHNRARDEAPPGRDHFGFADGISQPRIPEVAPPHGSYWSDQVQVGDIFRGYANSRGDTPDHLKDKVDELLDNGTFLVVRKIAQFPDRLEAVVSQAARRLKPEAGRREHKTLCEDIRARIMGRKSNGDPMLRHTGTGNNAFNYDEDAAGLRCPHRSHVRRANPRTSPPAHPAPRIVRRGMSYTTPPERAKETGSRGLVFMGYNASIAEQFEVIQRWLSGGNSSGLSSTDDDALLGVPEPGRQRTYRYVCQGKVVEVDLGSQPLTRLEWGIYAFVPSMTALQKIGLGKIPAVDAEQAQPAALPTPLETWRAKLEEDEKVRGAAWANARKAEEQGKPVNADGYGLLAGTANNVAEILRDDGSRFSVCGYAERMQESGLGVGYLGLDGKAHQDQSREVNEAIEKISAKEAFDDAFAAAGEVITEALKTYVAASGFPKGPLDVIEYGRSVLSKLCRKWFGLPDGHLMHHGRRADDMAEDGRTLCPGHFLTVSRYVFGPHPTPAVTHLAAGDGERVLAAVTQMLAKAKPDDLPKLVKAIVAADGIKGNGDLPARTVAGIMLGFPPTVLGNLVSVLMKWMAAPRLWELQQDWRADGDYDAAKALLEKPFLRTMMEDPTPYAVWRTAKTEQPLGQPAPANRKVIVGLGSAVWKDPQDHPALTEADLETQRHMLMFGGSRGAGEFHGTHACPGYGMAMGVMLGSVARLLQAGALAPTPDPRILILSAIAKPAPSPAPPPPQPEGGAEPGAKPSEDPAIYSLS